MNSEEDFSLLENSGMTSAGRGKFSTDFKAQNNESSAAKHSLQGGFSLTSAKQDKVSVSEIPDPLKVTEEPQAQILKPDLEIPQQAKIASIPLSFFPSKLQQLLLAAGRRVSEVRQATETPSVVIYIWPIIKMQESSTSFWHNFSKSFIPSSPGLTRYCSSPDVSEDEKCSPITPVKELAQEEPDGKTARSYPLIVKSSNSVVSELLKSLTNIKNKDYKNMLTLSSVSPLGEQPEIPLFKGNALMIYNGQVYLLYVMKHEDLEAEMKIAGHHMLFMKTVVWLITCRSVRKLTFNVPHPLLWRHDAVQQNMKCFTTCATPTRRNKTSSETHFSSHNMTTTSQPKNCSPLAGKRQQEVTYDDQFPSKTAFPSEEGLQERNDEEAYQEDKDKELRKKVGLVKNVRVVLNRLSPAELRKLSVKASALQKKGNH